MKKKLFLLNSLIIMSLLFVACNKDNMESNNKDETTPPVSEKSDDGDSEDENISYIELDSIKIKKGNDFAFDLFKAVCSEQDNDDKNVFISPLSMNLALDMLANGAVNETLSQILEVLDFKGYSMEDVNNYSRSLCHTLKIVDTIPTVSIANSIWCDNSFTVKDAFVKTNNTYYDAEVKNIDFSSSKALDTINSWCAEKTYNKIPKVLDDISIGTRMILINALYFKSCWNEMYAFSEEATSDEEFNAVTGTQTVKMMHKIGSYLYTSDENAAYLAIPFGYGAFRMIFALPKDEKKLQDIIDNMSNDTWITKNSLSQKYVQLSLPRFKAECSYVMNDALYNMGMKLPFSDNADFSGISDEKLYINKVIHKTFIDVNEKGAEAAAVTSLGFATCDGEEHKLPEPIIFKVNKPFVFSIYEESTGIILFIGKMGTIL